MAARIVSALAALSTSLLGTSAALAQDAYPPPPRGTAVQVVQRQNGELTNELATFSSVRVAADPYIVEGIRPLSGANLFTRKLVFKPGAKLIIVGPVEGNVIRIRADEIVIEGPGAGIYWSRPPVPQSPPTERGKAPSGTYGRSPGEPGGAGLDGEAGNPGTPGTDSVDIVMAFRSISGGDLDIDLRGSDGGPGGRGQDGGDGGFGAQGGPASSTFFSCKSGPGRGGDGGAGGRGGPPGKGGPGGRGGTLVILSPDSVNAGQVLHAYVGGGRRGPLGAPGNPGRGGQFGPEGRIAPPFCQSANRNGSTGRDGVAAAPVQASTDIADPGAFFAVPLSPELTDQLFPPAKQK